MIVINYGLPKSASSFVYQLTAGILSAAGHDQTAIRRAHLPEELRVDDLPLVPEILHTLLDSVPATSILTVKTHYPLEPLRDLTRNEQVRAIVTVRDPRDAIVSFIDFVPRVHINPARAALLRKYPRPDGEARVPAGPGPRRDVDFEVALQYYVQFCREAMTWWQATGFLKATFAEIVDAPHAVARRVAAHLGLETQRSRRLDAGRVARNIAARLGLRTDRPRAADAVDTDAIVDWFLTDRTRIWHYSTGERSRHRRAMTPEQIDRCDAVLGPYIEAFTGTSPPGARETAAKTAQSPANRVPGSEC